MLQWVEITNTGIQYSLQYNWFVCAAAEMADYLRVAIDHQARSNGHNPLDNPLPHLTRSPLLNQLQNSLHRSRLRGRA